MNQYNRHYWLHKGQLLKNVIKFSIYGILMRMKAMITGVHVPIGTRFYGMTSLMLHKSGTSRIHIGKNCTFRSLETSNHLGIHHRCILSAERENAVIEIGDHCGFSGTTIGSFEMVTIGNHVLCGANTVITDSDWHLDDPRSGPIKPVMIHDHVWIGTGSMIMKGVTIGENSIIGAGSVVVKDIPANVIAAGNPCKVIRELSS